MRSKLCQIELDERRREIAQNGTEMFPISGFYNNLEQMPAKEIPWHWHDEIEVIYIEKGNALFQIQQDEFVLKEDDGIFINANVVHSIKKLDTACIFYSFVFSYELLTGNSTSIINQRFINPLVQCSKLPYIKLMDTIAWQKEAATAILNAFVSYEKGNFGYEILVREQLSHMWYLLITNHMSQLQNNTMETLDVKRLKHMMEYIHLHYAQSITLANIAKSANISEREASRCFQKMLHDTPISYLMQYRISQAIKYLQNSEMAIIEVSTRCGFDDSSYFSKVFKKIMKDSPRDFRRKQKASI